MLVLRRLPETGFSKSCEHSFDLLAVGQLEDHGLDYFSTWLNELDDWYADDELLKSGQTELPDVIADFVDGEAEGIADEAFYKVTKGMPRCQMQDRIAFLTQCIDRTQTELATDVQHRPKYDAAAATRNKIRKSDPDTTILTDYQHQTEWHHEIRKIKWDCVPQEFAPLCYAQC